MVVNFARPRKFVTQPCARPCILPCSVKPPRRFPMICFPQGYEQPPAWRKIWLHDPGLCSGEVWHT